MTTPRPPADALERLRDVLRRCPYDGGMDMELGPVGCLLEVSKPGSCVCAAVASALSAPAAEPVAWLPIEQFVPRVGARAVLRLEHPNLEFAKGAERERWIDYQVGTWIDHNGGGWTWYGMLGRVTHFLPFEMPLAPITAKMEEPHDR